MPTCFPSMFTIMKKHIAIQIWEEMKMTRNKRAVSWLCIVFLLAAIMGVGKREAFAASADTPANGAGEKVNQSAAVDMAPTPEDFAGEYTCTTISFGNNIVPLDEDPYTLTIDGEEAVVVGLNELGTDPLKLQYEDGELYWIPPEESERVFTLRLQEDGVVTLTFDPIPEAPVFRFDPVEPTPEDFAGEYTCTTISFGNNIVPLGEDPYTLTINGEEAVVVGLNELGTDPLKLQYEDGELYWIPPEESERVFTLRLLEDGVVTLTFDPIPEAPVFRFDPVDSKG